MQAHVQGPEGSESVRRLQSAGLTPYAERQLAPTPPQPLLNHQMESPARLYDLVSTPASTSQKRSRSASLPAPPAPDLWIENPTHFLESTPVSELHTRDMKDDSEDDSMNFPQSPLAINLSGIRDVSSLRPFDLED